MENWKILKIFLLLDRNHVPPEDKGDRFKNPLISVYGPPGGGKSFFLDELAKLKEEDLKMVTKEDDRKFLKEMVPITISFDGRTPFGEEVENSQHAFLPRMLFRYIASPLTTVDSFFFWGAIGYRAFNQRFGYKLNFDLVISVIQHAIKMTYGSSRPILLIIDESTEVKNAQAMLKEIGGLLDIYPSSTFNAVLSTRDLDPFEKLKTTGRPIKWVQLPRFSIEESEQFFLRALEQE